MAVLDWHQLQHEANIVDLHIHPAMQQALFNRNLNLRYVINRSIHADPLRLSVDEVVARAIATNLELRASRKDISVAEANLERSQSLLPTNPSVTAGAQHATGFAPNYSFSLSQAASGGRRGRRTPGRRRRRSSARSAARSAGPAGGRRGARTARA